MKTSLSDKKSNVLCIFIPCGCSLWKLWVSFQPWWSELLWYCAFFGGWGWHSMISFNLMPFDLQLCIMFLYYSFDSSPCCFPLSLAYLSGTPLGSGVKRLFFFPCSIYLSFSFTSWRIYLALSSTFLLKFWFLYLSLAFWQEISGRLFYPGIMFNGSNNFSYLFPRWH